jgi:hypothetical protein
MPSSPKNLANRRNAQRSTGPTSAEGKLASSQNSRKHGLNIQVDFESSDVYVSLKLLLSEEGFSSFMAADIATSLLNYRRVMDAYYATYTSPEPVDEVMRDMNVKGSIPIFRELLSPSGSEPQDVRDMAAFFARMQRKEWRKGGPISRRSADTHKLIRYQRHAISRLSKAIRPA